MKITKIAAVKELWTDIKNLLFFLVFAIKTKCDGRYIGWAGAKFTHQRSEAIRPDNYVRSLYLVGVAVHLHCTRRNSALFRRLPGDRMSHRCNNLNACTKYENKSLSKKSLALTS